MTLIALPELLNNVLLTYYLEEVCGLSCRIYGVALDPIASFGDADSLPVLSPEVIEELGAAPVPVSIAGARACALFAKSELAGYVVVSTRNDNDAVAADFVFQLLNEQVTLRVAKDETEFDTNYLRNLINIMQRMFQKMAVVFDVRQAADIFINECQKLFAVRSGAIVMVDKNDLKLVSSFGAPFTDYESVGYVCFSGKPTVCNDVANDPRFTVTDEKGTRVRVNAKNVLVIPLFSGEKAIGAIYLCDKETGPFWIEDQRMAQTLGVVLGSTIANIQLHQSLVTNERIKSTLERYLSPNLVKELIAGGGDIQELGGRRVCATILFADIRGFTQLAERISAEQMVAQLNEYFEEMSKVIFAYDGTLDKYVGDMIMVLFGVPKPMPDAPLRAVKTAIEMQRRLELLNARWKESGRVAFGVGIGINIGDVIFGNIGSSTAMGMTVIGDHVNRAQRLETYAKSGEIIISDDMHDAVKAFGIKAESLGGIEVKGKKLQAYRVSY